MGRTARSEPLSEGRLAPGPWGRTLALAALVAVALLGAWEVRWRLRGVGPSIASTAASWSVARGRATSESVALLGTSKMQSALDPRILAPALGGVPVLQLALVDRSPLPVLEHLAADLRFAGVAVVDITPRIVFDATGLRDEAARDVMDESAALRRSPGEWIDARLGLGVEALLVLRRPDFSIRSIVDSWLPGRELELPLVTTRIDRFREIEFDRIDLDGRRVAQAVIVARNSRPPDEEGMAAIVRRTRTAARTIEGRGGRVVLVMLPVSDPAREVEERSFPRALYWDVLVEETGLPAIHFADHPALAEIECPDGLHMDRRVSREFSARFAPVLEAALDGAPAW